MKRLFVVLCVLAGGLAVAQDSLVSNTIVHKPTGPFPVFSGSPIQANRTASDPAPFPNINIVNNGQENETGIAVDPVDPNHLVAVANDFTCTFNGNPTMPYNYSTDAGLTWHYGCLPMPAGTPYNNPFDPTVCYDSRGNCYVCFGNTRGGNNGDDYQNGVYVCKSTDGGVTFQTATQVIANLANAKSGAGGTQPFEDKYFICADANPSSPNRDNIYVSWSHAAPASNFVIVCSRSIDGGNSWSNPVNVSRGGGPQGSVPACGPNGEVYVAWANSAMSQTSQIMIARSEDGGQSFGAPVQVAQVQSVGVLNTTNGRLELTDKQSMRIATFPSLAVDNSSGPHKGRVYLVWQGKNSVPEPHIFMATSDNKGVAWSSARVIDQANSGLDVYMPAIACDPTTGLITVDYFDSRNSSDNSGFDLYASQSNNGGATFTEYRITSVTTTVYSEGQGASGGSYFGDYQGMCSYGGTAWPCWWDCRTGAGYNYCHIYTAVIRSSASPVTALSAKTTCDDPTTVKLTWVDPTTTTTGQPLTSFTINIVRNGTQVGTANKGDQAYADHGLSPGTTYAYDVVVNSSAGQSTPAHSTIIAGGAGIANPISSFAVRPVTGGVEARWVNPSTHIDGTTACDLHAVYVYSDTNSIPIDSLMITGTNGGQPSKTLLLLDTTKIWKLSARVATVSGGLVKVSDTSNHVTTFAGAPRPAPHYNFDGPAVTTYATGVWGTTNLAAKSAPNSLTDSPTGNSTRNQTSFCALPPFVVSAQDTSITFYHILIDDKTGNAYVDITTDNGVTWHVIRGFNQLNHPTEWKSSSVDSNTWFFEHRSILTGSTGAVLAHVGDTAIIRFRIQSTFAVRDGWFIDDVIADNTPADAVRESGIAPSLMSLDQNYPNPFTPATQVRFSVPASEHVTLTVVDAIGRTVATLLDGAVDGGSYISQFNASGLPSGTYYAVLRGGGQQLRRAMQLVK